MIIIGYQGIGKSTLASQDPHYIDLESSNFFVDGKRDENWFIVYGQIAESLSRQGYDVFVSSHAPVRDYLSHSEEKVIVVTPAVELKDQWIEKLKQRWEKSKLDKDFRAYANAADRYVDNVVELMQTPNVEIKTIHSMNYSLKEIVNPQVYEKIRKCPYVYGSSYPRCMMLRIDDGACLKDSGLCRSNIFDKGEKY